MHLGLMDAQKWSNLPSPEKGGATKKMSDMQMVIVLWVFLLKADQTFSLLRKAINTSFNV